MPGAEKHLQSPFADALGVRDLGRRDHPGESVGTSGSTEDSTFVLVEVVLLIGARPHCLTAEQARWLEDRIRSTCVDDMGRPPDSDALACLQLADVLAEDLDAGEHIEPIELGRSHAVGLTEYVLNVGAAAEHDMPAFYEALIRFRG